MLTIDNVVNAVSQRDYQNSAGKPIPPPRQFDNARVLGVPLVAVIDNECRLWQVFKLPRRAGHDPFVMLYL
jgi:hypothetical protein